MQKYKERFMIVILRNSLKREIYISWNFKNPNIFSKISLGNTLRHICRRMMGEGDIRLKDR